MPFLLLLTLLFAVPFSLKAQDDDGSQHALAVASNFSATCAVAPDSDYLAPSRGHKDIPTVRTGRMWFGLGYADELDTYLGQEKFTGMELRFVSEKTRQRVGRKAINEVTHQVLFANAGTRGNDHCLLMAMYNLQAGRGYAINLHVPNLFFSVGALADATLGASYNTRNSNNPAQMRLSLSIDPTVRMKWRFRLWRRNMELNYNAAMPLVGLAFSPNYGQSYYEIFSQGNYDHNCVVTSPFSSGPQLHQRLTVDFPIGRATLSVGYLGDVLQMEANNLRYHHYTHALIIGWRYR